MINQTNRTILFDVINPEVYSLSDLMAGTVEGVSSLTDEKIKEVNEALLVGNFDEFLQKFKPTIYSYFDENNMPQHSLVKPVGVPEMFVKEIVLDRNNRILKMFTSMMDRKRTSNATNVTFDYEAVTKLLAPEKALKEMQKIKMEIRYLEGQNATLERDSPAKADAVKKLLSKYESTRKYYNETGAQLALTAGMLKENLLAIESASLSGKGYAPPAVPVFEDGELVSITPSEEFLALSAAGFGRGGATQLLEGGGGAGGDGAGAGAGAGGGATQLLEGGTGDEGDGGAGGDGSGAVAGAGGDGSGAVAVAVAGSGGAVGHSASAAKLLEDGSYSPAAIDYKQYTINTLEKYYDQSMAEIYSSVGNEYNPEKGSFHRELVLSAFTDRSNIALMRMGKEEKVEKYNRFSALHALWEKSFIREAKVLIEKILNVKAFFDQYKPKLPKMRPKLLIVNSRLENIVEDSYFKQLQQYLESVNNKLECTDTIWFGIVPDIKFSEGDDEPDIDLQTMRDMGFTGDFETGSKIAPNEMMCLQMLLDGIKKYRIQTFFSFETGDDTTFSRLATHGIDAYIEKTQALVGADYDKFSIACLPNFTVIPRDRSKVVYGSRVYDTGKGVSFSEDVEDQFKFWIYGVYVSAAYVAAGLTAASQCPSYLATRFGNAKKVAKDLPGVRFDIEADNNSEIVTTTFSKEIAGITNDDRQKLNDNNFGYVFSSDKSGNIVVFKARSMYEKDGSFVSLFKETTTSYILRMLRILSSDKRAGIEKQYAPGGQVKKWELVKGYVNSILGDSDSIGIPATEDGVSRIEVVFGGTAEYINLEIIAD